MQHKHMNEARAALARDGIVRAAINVSNPALAKPGPDGPTGITVNLSQQLAAELKARLELVVCESAAQAVEVAKSGKCDIAFMAIDPAREEDFAFSKSYLTIEGVFAVRSESALKAAGDVDQAGVRIAASGGAAYTQFLSRTLKSADLVTVPDGFKAFSGGNVDAVAGIREAVERFAGENEGVRVLSRAFMEIKQAIAVTKANGAAAIPFIDEFLAREFDA
jgi:polar amino acid transport system substrate-binding protein